MGFIEQYLRKPAREVTIDDLSTFVIRKNEENLNLEYKDIRYYERTDELSKKIAGFTNSAGGLLVLGVSEEDPEGTGRNARVFPSAITWGDSSLSRETLEDRLNARIQPRVEGLKIVPLRDKKSQVVFLLDVPASDDRPRMAYDNRYYKRLNFETVPMEHYEVEAFFGRRRHPKVLLLLELIKINRTRRSGSTSEEVSLNIGVHLVNEGKAAAKHTMATIEFRNQDIINIPIGTFVRVDDLRQGVPAVQFSNDVGVLHAAAAHRYNLGEIDVRVRDAMQDINFLWSVVAEDMDMTVSEFTLSPIALEEIRTGHKVPLFLNISGMPSSLSINA